MAKVVTIEVERDRLNNLIASAKVGQDVSSLLAARDWYNRRVAQGDLGLEDKQIAQLQEQRCDCVLSIRNATKCWRCRELQSLLETSLLRGMKV